MSLYVDFSSDSFHGEFQIFSREKISPFQRTSWQYDSALKITHGPLFGPVLSYLNQTGPKSKISTIWKWTKIKIGKISGHVILIFGEKLERTKTENFGPKFWTGPKKYPAYKILFPNHMAIFSKIENLIIFCEKSLNCTIISRVGTRT